MKNRTEQNRTEQNRTEQNRTEQNRTEQVYSYNLNISFHQKFLYLRGVVYV
ncbi:hypothetical protein [uncultured Brachyspira sp.]|uniref:hypothetical protein n=1 Tax=uncultured Brachyspira sp. TaxID=221953 RepID=UPI00259BBDEA|nr:hypothetical protein [uncultured Brachyspira sp.]